MSKSNENPRDFSRSGLGIGSLGRHIEDPVIPSLAALKRIEKAEETHPRTKDILRRIKERDKGLTLY